ncbi:hypothetical protein PIB30_019184 [Stylosanthes scabra]|uniref:Uncharacterized protein n=1 Tax=Stylosanthes scabra TaxID=79078 RepID=A0ABU6Z8N1_9FABA|nr:hypothetical protein [Stylosanthes scabra]
MKSWNLDVVALLAPLMVSRDTLGGIVTFEPPTSACDVPTLGLCCGALKGALDLGWAAGILGALGLTSLAIVGQAFLRIDIFALNPPFLTDEAAKPCQIEVGVRLLEFV